MIRMTFIGSGSAFTTDDNYQSNVLFESTIDPDKRMLLDCGGDARWGLKELGLNYRHIDAVYISHLHNDHIGGLEWLAFARKFDPACERPILYLSRYLKNPIWNNALSAGLSSLQGEVADLHTYFDVNAVGKNGFFFWNNIQFQLVQTMHVMDGYQFMYSFGLLFKVGDTKIYFTTDTQFAPEQITTFYDMADIVFHDCETLPYESGVHANYMKLKTLPEKTKAKMWLYHYNPGTLPNAQEDGFRGFITKGQSFEFNM